MMKNFIKKILNVPKLIRRIWFLLWILLAILLIMKFCFGIWYPIVINNKSLMSFNDFIRDSWLRYLILGLFYLLSGNILYLTSSIKKKYNKIIELIFINILIILSFILKIKIEIVGTIIELIISIAIPMIYLIKERKCFKLGFRIIYPIMIQLLISIWQLNIFFIRNIDMNKINNDYFIIGFALQLDYYIFLIITWIGVSFMGLWSFWFFSKDITTLKAYKEKELAKAKPDMDLVAKIDAKIEKLEKEGK